MDKSGISKLTRFETKIYKRYYRTNDVDKMSPKLARGSRCFRGNQPGDPKPIGNLLLDDHIHDCRRNQIRQLVHSFYAPAVESDIHNPQAIVDNAIHGRTHRMIRLEFHRTC